MSRSSCAAASFSPRSSHRSASELAVVKRTDGFMPLSAQQFAACRRTLDSVMRHTTLRALAVNAHLFVHILGLLQVAQRVVAGLHNETAMPAFACHAGSMRIV